MRVANKMMGILMCLTISSFIFVGCSDDPEANDLFIHAWENLQTGFTTTLSGNGTYSVALGATVWQTGTWSTEGSNITFNPNGDEPATMTYTLSADGKTMTIYDDGETTVLTRQ